MEARHATGCNEFHTVFTIDSGIFTGAATEPTFSIDSYFSIKKKKILFFIFIFFQFSTGSRG